MKSRKFSMGWVLILEWSLTNRETRFPAAAVATGLTCLSTKRTSNKHESSLQSRNYLSHAAPEGTSQTWSNDGAPDVDAQEPGDLVNQFARRAHRHHAAKGKGAASVCRAGHHFVTAGPKS